MKQPLHARRPRNYLLSMLSPTDFGLLASDLEPVVLRLGLMLEVPNKPITHVYFPEAGIVWPRSTGSISRLRTP